MFSYYYYYYYYYYYCLLLIYVIDFIIIIVHSFLIKCFEPWGKLAQKWLVCAPLEDLTIFIVGYSNCIWTWMEVNDF